MCKAEFKVPVRFSDMACIALNYTTALGCLAQYLKPMTSPDFLSILYCIWQVFAAHNLKKGAELCAGGIIPCALALALSLRQTLGYLLICLVRCWECPSISSLSKVKADCMIDLVVCGLHKVCQRSKTSRYKALDAQLAAWYFCISEKAHALAFLNC